MPFDGRVLSGIGVLSAVVDAGSFARAATSLGLTQSGVSRAIARLEERVGVRLLQRSARAVTLTDDGRRFYDRVAPLISGIEDAATDAGASAVTVKGNLRVLVDSLVARVVIAPRIPDFLARNPELHVELVVRAHLGDLIAEGFDVAVRFGEPEPSTLIARKLRDAAVVTVAAPSYLDRHGRPKHPRELARHACLLYRDPVSGRPYEWVFQKGKQVIEVKVQGRLTMNDSGAALAACIGGSGVAQPLDVQIASVPPGQLEVLFPAWGDERFPLYAYYPSRHLPSAKVRAFLDFVIGAAGA